MNYTVERFQSSLLNRPFCSTVCTCDRLFKNLLLLLGNNGLTFPNSTCLLLYYIYILTHILLQKKDKCWLNEKPFACLHFLPDLKLDFNLCCVLVNETI